jgi:vacuolar-type H+-ATPase subunit F/Vma7
MTAPVYIGPEAGAAAFRLAGARVLTPPDGELEPTLARVAAEADLVLLSADLAEALPPERLAELHAARRPLLLVVPDLAGRAPDLAGRIRAQLGVGG